MDEDNGVLVPGALPELGFERDMKREEEGVRVSLEEVPTFRPNLEGSVKWVQVRSRFTKAFKKAEQRAVTRSLRMKQTERYQFMLELNPKLVAEHLIVGWEILDRNGNQLPYTPQAALSLMTNPKYRDFAAFVDEAVSLVQGDLDEAKEVDTGKS